MTDSVASTSTLPTATVESSKALHPCFTSRTNVIQSGDQVMLKLPSGLIKMIEVKGEKTISLGKFGSFPSSALLNQPYGITYQIVEPTEPGAKPTLRALKGEGLADVEDTMATNELIEEGNEQQLLTDEEIKALKASGASAQDIIAKQIERHTAFHLKTDYSKEKYKKRKEKKFGRSFRPLAPTVPNLLSYHVDRQASYVMNLREDTFAQLLSFANIRSGGRYLVVDDCGGLVVGGILERMGGKGKIMTFSDSDSAPAHNILMTQMNYPKELIEETVKVLNWAESEEDWIAPEKLEELPPRPAFQPGEATQKIDRERAKIKKRLATKQALEVVRDELHLGEWDGLVIASNYEPYSIIEKLTKYLAGSANIVVYSPYLQVLTAAHTSMRAHTIYLNPSITESWLRKWQVLPGRTHPFMNMSGSGGFLLTATKVYADHKTSSVLATRHLDRAKASARKKQKVLEAAEKEAAGPIAVEGAISEDIEVAVVADEETAEERQAREDEEAMLNGEEVVEKEKFEAHPSSAPERMEVDSLLGEEETI
ncbi:Gcd10p family-domain-containing protein [Mrakia frigida]|uniref:tRNA 1-methyladenosine methyltransferase subunit GCD10 n=1 Tax=Mrakia frigida TaxID=29902 RepID=UPI003FCC0392